MTHNKTPQNTGAANDNRATRVATRIAVSNTSHMANLKVSTLALLMATAHQPLKAAEADNVAANEVEIAELGGLVEEITVSATKSEQSSYRVPASVSVVTKEEIDQLVPITISDLFYDVPNVLFTGGPRRNGQVPSIRGTGGAGVLILFDGIRQNFLSAHDGRFFIEPSLLKSAEVVRGPASSLYGAGALGGVIAFETLTAKDFLGDAQSGVQVFANVQSAVDNVTLGTTGATQSSDGKLGIIGNFTYRDSAEIELGDGSTLFADDEISSGLAKVNYAVSDALNVSAQWVGYRGSAVEPNNGQGLTFGDLVDKDIVSDTLRVGVDYNPQNPLINVGVIGYYANNRVTESELDSERAIERTMESYGFLVDNRSELVSRNDLKVNLIVGAEYYEDEQAGLDNTTSDGTRGGVPDANGQTFGAFLSAEIDANTDFGDFLITPSIRYDSFQSEMPGRGIENDADEISFRIAASWRPIPEILLFGSYGEAFRAPSFNEIFADGVHFQIPLGPFVTAPNLFIPNADLMPEDSGTYEAGIGFDFDNLFTADDKLRLKSTYFNSDVNNLIDLEVNVAFSPSCFAPIPGICTAGTSRNVNTTNANLEGFELEASYQSKYVYATAAFATITGRDQDEGDFVGILTPDRFTIDSGLKLDDLGLRGGYRLEVNGRFVEVNDLTAIRAGFEILDLYASWAPVNGPLKGFRLDVGVDNVTDATAERVFAGVPDLGRNYKAALSYTLKF